jgi:O-antigen/teichoic acid export membrane protein
VNALGIHIALGAAVALAAWMLCPWAAARSAGSLYAECLWSLRFSCVLIVIRAVETVWVSTLRGASLYGQAFYVSGICRLLTLAAALALPLVTKSVAAMLGAAVLICGCGLVAQKWLVKRALGMGRVTPRLERHLLAPLLAFGAFTWIQSAAGLVFTQIDRLIVGVAFGATQVAAYAICAQLTQPIYGIAAAGLHFMFPYMARNKDGHSGAGLLWGFTANAAFVATAVALLMLYGRRILVLIGGRGMDGNAEHLLLLLTYASALAALSVTGTYAMLALGRARQVAVCSVAGGLLGALALLPLTRLMGVAGPGYARILYGIVILTIYIPLSAHFLGKARPARRTEPWLEDA